MQYLHCHTHGGRTLGSPRRSFFTPAELGGRRQAPPSAVVNNKGTITEQAPEGYTVCKMNRGTSEAWARDGTSHRGRCSIRPWL